MDDIHRARGVAGAGPIFMIILSFPVALYSATVISDIAYLNTAVIQWTNFSSWLLVGANAIAGVLLVWTIAIAIFKRGRSTLARRWFYPVLLAIMFVLGLLNSFQHARDGWHSVGALGLILSILCALLALAAAFIAGSRSGFDRTAS